MLSSVSNMFSVRYSNTSVFSDWYVRSPPSINWAILIFRWTITKNTQVEIFTGATYFQVIKNFLSI